LSTVLEENLGVRDKDVLSIGQVAGTKRGQKGSLDEGMSGKCEPQKENWKNESGGLQGEVEVRSSPGKAKGEKRHDVAQEAAVKKGEGGISLKRKCPLSYDKGWASPVVWPKKRTGEPASQQRP